MKIVLDTNVLLSGMLFGGVCGTILDALTDSSTQEIVISQHILDEFRRHAQVKFKAPPASVHRALTFLKAQCELIEPAAVPADACRDPDDLPVLGTAVAAKALCLVTGDADLLEMGTYQGISILSPRDFYERLR